MMYRCDMMDDSLIEFYIDTCSCCWGDRGESLSSLSFVFLFLHRLTNSILACFHSLSLSPSSTTPPNPSCVHSSIIQTPTLKRIHHPPSLHQSTLQIQINVILWPKYPPSLSLPTALTIHHPLLHTIVG